MFDEMEDFRGFLGTAVLGLLADDQVNVDVGVNKVAVGRTTDGPLARGRAGGGVEMSGWSL